MGPPPSGLAGGPWKAQGLTQLSSCSGTRAGLFHKPRTEFYCSEAPLRPGPPDGAGPAGRQQQGRPGSLRRSEPACWARTVVPAPCGFPEGSKRWHGQGAVPPPSAPCLYSLPLPTLSKEINQPASYPPPYALANLPSPQGVSDTVSSYSLREWFSQTGSKKGLDSANNY